MKATKYHTVFEVRVTLPKEVLRFLKKLTPKKSKPRKKK